MLTFSGAAAKETAESKAYIASALKTIISIAFPTIYVLIVVYHSLGVQWCFRRSPAQLFKLEKTKKASRSRNHNLNGDAHDPIFTI